MTPEALEPGPGLPAKVVSAWQRGDAVVLPDREARRGGRPPGASPPSRRSPAGRGVSVFVAPAEDVARLLAHHPAARRQPRPRPGGRQAAQASAAPTPQALVSYGFRDAAERRAGGGRRPLCGQGQRPVPPGIGAGRDPTGAARIPAARPRPARAETPPEPPPEPPPPERAARAAAAARASRRSAAQPPAAAQPPPATPPPSAPAGRPGAQPAGRPG